MKITVNQLRRIIKEEVDKAQTDELVKQILDIWVNEGGTSLYGDQLEQVRAAAEKAVGDSEATKKLLDDNTKAAQSYLMAMRMM